MYAFVAKGYTVGQVLTRRVLRTLTSVPGIIIDAIFLAPFFGVPDYRSFWEIAEGGYADGVREKGVVRVITGWIGDIVGFLIGSVVGVVLGIACYIPDIILVNSFGIYEWLANSILNLAKSIAQHEYFFRITHDDPETSYRKTAWNISIGTLGVVLSAPLYVTAKILENFLPIGNRSSHIAWATGLLLGGVTGSLISMAYYPVHKALTNTIKLYHSFRNAVRFGVAMVYAKTNQELFNDRDCFGQDGATHSDEFKQTIQEAKQTTTARLIYGPLKQPEYKEVKPVAPPANVDIEDYFQDPVSLQRMTRPVMTKCNHTFDETTVRSLVENNQTCPLDRTPIKLNEVRPNLLVQSMLDAKLRLR